MEMANMKEPRNNRLKNVTLRVGLLTGMLAAASAIGGAFGIVHLPEANIVLVYLLAVQLTAWLTQGFVYGIIASVIATFAFNYLFTEPYLTFSVSDPDYIVTLIILTVTALITSALTSHVKQGAALARQREAEIRMVYNLTNHLIDARDMHHIAEISAEAISGIFGCDTAIQCLDGSGMSEGYFSGQTNTDMQIKRSVGDSVVDRHYAASLKNANNGKIESSDWPIYGRECILGIVRIPDVKASLMTEQQRRLLNSLIECTALAMDRFRSSMQRTRANEEAMKEHYRGNLLRAISHDLRTPLTGIIGTSEMLMGMTDPGDQQHSLAEDIYKDAEWLHALVENILSLTRMNDGELLLTKKLEAVEEVIGESVNHVTKRSPGYDITVSMPDELLMVPMDAKLIKQVLINLLDNSVKHTMPENEILVKVTENKQAQTTVFSVSDKGTGIAEADLPHIFKMFYTTRGSQGDTGHGIGLGLAICESIIKAHGGSITARNRADGTGAEFIFTLPMEA
jgi:two-component system, OmpR family, sensor histidine kinase KdpD